MADTGGRVLRFSSSRRILARTGTVPSCVGGRMVIGKALILSGGEDESLAWPTALAEPRQLFPIANQPILFHNLEALRAAGVVEAAILADRASGAAIRRAVGDGS